MISHFTRNYRILYATTKACSPHYLSRSAPPLSVPSSPISYAKSYMISWNWNNGFIVVNLSYQYFLMGFCFVVSQVFFGLPNVKRDQGSLQIANGGMKACFVRRSWRGSNPRRQPPREQGMSALTTRPRPPYCIQCHIQCRIWCHTLCHNISHIRCCIWYCMQCRILHFMKCRILCRMRCYVYNIK